MSLGHDYLGVTTQGAIEIAFASNSLKMQIKLFQMFLNDQSPLSFTHAPGNGSILNILNLKKN